VSAYYKLSNGFVGAGNLSVCTVGFIVSILRRFDAKMLQIV
jgi:hypothetical protein